MEHMLQNHLNSKVLYFKAVTKLTRSLIVDLVLLSTDQMHVLEACVHKRRMNGPETIVYA